MLADQSDEAAVEEAPDDDEHQHGHERHTNVVLPQIEKMLHFKFMVLSGEAIEKFSNYQLAEQIRRGYRSGVKEIQIVERDSQVQPLVDEINRRKERN